jgi:1,2-diacylglycerol 3-alpha-glucosyltransferase
MSHRRQLVGLAGSTAFLQRVRSLPLLCPRFGHLAHTRFGVSREDLAECLKQQRETGCHLGEALRSRGLLDREQTKSIIQAQARSIAAVAHAIGAPVEFPLATSLSLCMPAFNEAKNIEDVLDGACAILPEFVSSYEIIVVDDGSRDGTGEVLARYAESEQHLKIVTHTENRGYGAALTSGLRASKGELVLTLDSDGQFNLLNLPEFLWRMQDADVVIGYRKKRADSRIRLFNAWAWNRLMRVLLGVSVRDLDCAFKLFRRETVQALSLTSRGACISAEILVQCVRNRKRFAEVPVDHYPRSHGAPTGAALKVIARAFRELPHLMKYRWSRRWRPPQAGQPIAGVDSPTKPATIRSLFTAPKNDKFLPSHNGNGKHLHGRLVGPPTLSADGQKEELPDLTMTVCKLLACPFPANHGTPGSVREIAEAVAERGHEVHLVTYHIGEDIPVRGVQLHRIASRSRETIVVGPTWHRPFYDFRMIFKTLEVIRHYRPNVLHAHGYEATMVAWVCRLLSGVPVLYSAHNTMADELPTYKFIRPRWLAGWFGEALDRVVPRMSDRIVPHSGNLEAFLGRRNLLERTEPVIKFGINLDDIASGDAARLRERYGLGQDPVLLYAGVMNPFQRLDLLLKAMALVVRQMPTAKLLMVRTLATEPFLADFCQQAEDLGLRGQIVITQPQPLRSVQEHLAACDVAVAPRTHEPGFPIKVLNAMAAGKACVMYASSSRDLRHKKDAYLVAPDTPEALADGLLEVLADGRLRERLGRNGREYVRQNHDRRLIAAQLGDVYSRMLLGRRPQRPLESGAPTSPVPGSHHDSHIPVREQVTIRVDARGSDGRTETMAQR